MLLKGYKARNRLCLWAFSRISLKSKNYTERAWGESHPLRHVSMVRPGRVSLFSSAGQFQCNRFAELSNR
jgi:hypothetical protein